MTKEEIGTILKKSRILSGKTQKEVAEILGRKQQIIGHWETGYSQPDANTLFVLCDIYGTTVDEAFGLSSKKDKNYSLEDQNILKKYHILDEYGKETVNIILDREALRAQAFTDKQDSDIDLLIARNGKPISADDKKRLIKLLSEIE